MIAGAAVGFALGSLAVAIPVWVWLGRWIKRS